MVIKPGGAPAENMCSQATKLWDRVSYVIDEQEVGDNEEGRVGEGRGGRHKGLEECRCGSS